MGKRYMTLTDLYNFYFSQGKTQKFSCQDNGDTIVVRANGTLNFSKEDAKDGLYPTRVQMNFVGDNLNNSRIEMKSQEKALPSSHYRPLLAYIHDVDGEPQFYGHNMEIDENGDIDYIEQPVGVIAEEAHIEHDDDYDKDYAVALGYIWEEYNKAAYILERDKRCDVSVELSIRSLSYNAQDKILVLDDFYYSGCTILGVDEDGKKINPAMPGSNITLADFSAKNNSIVYSDKLIQTLESLNETLSKFEINTTRKEEDSVDLENKEIETMEESTKKKIEDDDSVATATEEDNADSEKEDTTPIEDTPSVANEIPEVDEENSESDDIEEDSDPSDNVDNTFSTEDETEKDMLQCSVKIGENIKNFSVSMNAKIEALSQLVNDTYSDDMTWYCTEVYDDDKTVVMIDCWTGKAYRQSYKVKDDVFSLKGDRVEVYSTWMTLDEQKAFESMKTKFEEISEKLAKYEAEPEKIKILESVDYSSIIDKEEFIELKKQKNHFDLSVDELKTKADEIILSYAKKGALTFANVESKEVGKKQLPTTKKTTKRSRYGGLGKKED